MKSTRLDKLVANLGYGSRRDVALMVRTGRITLDGGEVTAADARLTDVEAMRLRIDDEPIDPLPGLVIALNKSVGVTCSHKEAGPLVYGLLPERWRRRDPPLSSVGRLDKETSGLLLITDDGALLHRIISPKARVPKRYLATLARPLRGDEGATFASGSLMLDGETTPLRPAVLEMLGPTFAHVTVEEGRYHQVRRMFAAVGNHVETLHRVAVGGVTLPEGLKPGAYKLLEPDEVTSIFATFKP